MRKPFVMAVLAVLTSAAAADPIGRPWDLMDLAGGRARMGAEINYSNVGARGFGRTEDVFELDLVGQFPVSHTIDLWARVPMATGEDNGIIGDVGIGILANLHDSTTSSGGHLKFGIEGGVYLPTGSAPDVNNINNYLGAGMSRTFLFPRFAGRVLTLRGAFGLRFETGKAFFFGQGGLDMGNETENRSSRNDNTHFYLHVGGGGGAEVARNLALIGELTYIDELDDNNFDGPALALTGGLRYRTGKVTLGGALLKSIDLPGTFSSFGLRFDVLFYF